MYNITLKIGKREKMLIAIFERMKSKEKVCKTV